MEYEMAEEMTKVEISLPGTSGNIQKLQQQRRSSPNKIAASITNFHTPHKNTATTIARQT